MRFHQSRGFLTTHPRLALFLIGWILGLLMGFGLAKGVFVLQLEKLWSNTKSPTPAPTSTPTPPPTISTPQPPKPQTEPRMRGTHPTSIAPNSVPDEPTLKTATGYQKPNLYLGCQNTTLTQTIPKNLIQQINLSQCQPGKLTVSCISRNNPCGVAARIGSLSIANSSYQRPGIIEVKILRSLEVDVRIAIIASQTDIYTLVISYSPNKQPEAF